MCNMFAKDLISDKNFTFQEIGDRSLNTERHCHRLKTEKSQASLQGGKCSWLARLHLQACAAVLSCSFPLIAKRFAGWRFLAKKEVNKYWKVWFLSTASFLGCFCGSSQSLLASLLIFPHMHRILRLMFIICVTLAKAKYKKKEKHFLNVFAILDIK